MTISVLVVQDHTTTLEGWRVLLGAEDGRTAVDLVRGGPPDVVVMECVLPELNGVPGPIHLLEMKDEIDLNESQRSAIGAIYRRMKSKAILHGERLIDLERRLESGFRDRTITDALLRASLSAIAETKKELRYVHLAAHIETLKVLSEKQIRNYNALRGYSNPDPCANVPKGHNAEMWRRHNNCD